MTSNLMIKVSRQQLEYWMVMLRAGLPETVSSMIQTVLETEAPEAPRQSDAAALLRDFSEYGSSFTFKSHPAIPSNFPTHFPWFEAGWKLGNASAPLSPDHSDGIHNAGSYQIGSRLPKSHQSMGDGGGSLLNWNGDEWVEGKDEVVLTDDQILEAMREHIYAADGGYVFDTEKDHVIAAGRALIDKIKELNK